MEKKLNITPENAPLNEVDDLYKDVDGEKLATRYVTFLAKNKYPRTKLAIQMKFHEATIDSDENRVRNLMANLYARAFTDLDNNLLQLHEMTKDPRHYTDMTNYD